jgi:hypothetical protein
VASRKEQKEALRREREQREAEAAAAARRRRTLGYGLASALVLAVIIAAGAIALSGGDGDGDGSGGGASYPEEAKLPPRRTEDLEPAARAAGCTLKRYPNFGAQHTEDPPPFRTNPPTSGNHSPRHTEDLAFKTSPPTAELVHTLEHGRVILQFKPSAPDAVRGQLKALYDEDPLYVVLTPNNTGMRPIVAATAWRQLLGCPRLDARTVDALRAFRDRYRDRAPEPASAS